ncbi:hypothetical protein M0412_08760 [Agrobacterium sp. O3.4]|uniref:Uncharacterized protein n=1 Tax=Agrobacterium cucumeris TaxID=2862866 RepID=A0ABY8RM87_9HYPH|nr:MULTISPECIES: hypothetical protein [Rhizobium/Agrobacterium group]MCZ7468149.1 hypothetical protein [Rhizobium rhizogenes]WHO08705.1 hypothetical protein KZ699_02600 [Agrobacterium cucumeris]
MNVFASTVGEKFDTAGIEGSYLAVNRPEGIGDGSAELPEEADENLLEEVGSGRFPKRLIPERLWSVEFWVLTAGERVTRLSPVGD